MMKRSMQSVCSAALTMSAVSALYSFVFYAVRFFSALRFYFNYYFTQLLPSKSQLVS